MPLDTLILQVKDRDWKNHCIGWEFKFSLLPRRCHYTDKNIWLKWSYKGTAMWTGPGDPIFENRWIEKNQYLLEKLKGNI